MFLLTSTSVFRGLVWFLFLFEVREAKCLL